MKSVNQQLPVLYNIAMSIGTSMDRQQMLENAIKTYMHNLGCFAGSVYCIRKKDDDILMYRQCYIYPANRNADDFQEIRDYISTLMSTDSRVDDTGKYQHTRKLTSGHYGHIMKLGSVGYLTLLKDSEPLDESVVLSLAELNDRLALSYESCINHEILRANESKFRRIFENMQDVYYQTTLDGTITEISQSVSTYGYSREMLLGQNVERVYANPETRNDLIGRLKESGSVTDYEIELRESKGNRLFVSTSSQVIFNIDGTPLRIEGVLRNITERKFAEESLKKHAGLINSLLDSIPDLIFFKDKNGKYLGCNPAFTEFAGKPREEIIGKTDFELFNRKTADHFYAIEQKLLQQREPFHSDEWLVHPGGKKVLMDALFTTYMDQDGSLIGLLGIFRDITLRRQTDEKLKESEKNFRNFFETMDDMIIICNQQGKLLYTNSAVERKLGYTAAELELMNVLDVHPNNRRKEAAKIFSEMFKGLKDQCPLPLVTNQGVLIPVESRVWFGQWNGEDCIFCISKDLTKQQEALQKFDRMFNSNPALMAVSDVSLGRKFNEVNQAFLDALGYTRAEVIGKTIKELNLFSEPDKQKIIEEELIKKGHVRNVELKVNTNTGKTLDGIFSGEIIENHGKQYFLTVMTDITDRKKAEEEVKESKQRLYDILDNLNDVIWSASYPDEKVLFVSPSIEKLFGVKTDEFEADIRLWHRFIHLEDRQKVMDAYTELKNTGKSMAEFRITSPDGSVKWLQEANYYVTDKDGRPVRIDGSIKDITGQKEFQYTLEFMVQMAKAFINVPVENLSEEINKALNTIGEYVDADRTYIFDYDFINNTTTNTYEWCAKDITPEIVNLQDIPLEAIPQWVSVHRKGNELYIPNVQNLSGNDPVRKILEPQGVKSLLTLPMIDNDKLYGFVGFDSVRNLHEYSASERSILTVFTEMLVNVKGRLQSLNQLSEAKEAAETANKAKSEFLANMSHEIRTPMNAILGFSEALYHKLDSPQNKKMVKSVLNSGNLLLSLLNDILDLSKIEAGKLELSLQPINLKAIINEIKLLYQDKVQRQGLSISVEIDNSLPEAFSLDEVRIKQILFNLVGNAVKFTNKGYVKIKAEYSPVNDHLGDLSIEVQDTGIGIPDDQQDVIFEAFRQQAGLSTRIYGGIGLGLAISKRLAVKMGGTISVRSKVNEGSVFTLLLPNVKKTRSESAPTEAGISSQKVQFQNASVLVVDDVVSNIWAVESLLADCQLDLIHAESGEMTLEILNHKIPDLILLDIRMPGLNGYEVARIIKENPSLRHISIVALTASVTSKYNKSLSEYFDGFLYKPVKKADLVAELMKHLKYITLKPHEEVKQNLDLLFHQIPEGVKSQLPEVLQLLNHKSLPHWEKIRDSLDLLNIGAFAADLEEISRKYNIVPLTQYAGQIAKDIDDLDLESLQENLLQFGTIVDLLSKIQYKNNFT
jgi:PAS domain S-box-containing protein